MAIELQQVILGYPPSFFLQKMLETGFANLTKSYGVGAYVNYQTATLIAYASPGGCRLEKVFSPEAVEKLRQADVKVQLIYCPVGTTAIAITYPEKDWEGRDKLILCRWYEAEGYNAAILHEARKLILTSRVADLNNLPFSGFLRRGCGIEFIE